MSTNNQVIEFNSFNLSTALKTPTALGMERYTFHFGFIDGVEAGRPWDTEEETLEDLKSILTCDSKTQSLILSLQASIQNNQWILTQPINDKQREAVLLDQNRNSALLEKIQAFKPKVDL